MSRLVYLYHGDCVDGFTAAWVANLTGRENGTRKNAIFEAVRYGQEPGTPIAPGDIAYCLDIMLPNETTRRLYDQSRNPVIVLDHHATRAQDFKDLHAAGVVAGRFEIGMSGAMLAWDWFIRRYDGAVSPDLVRYVQDRDLWLWELPQSREISAWLRTLPMDFETWDWAALKVAEDTGLVVAAGTAVLAAETQQVERMCREAVLRPWPDREVWVPITNATTLISEVGERLGQLYPDAPFTASYRDLKTGWREWSLRTNRKDVHVGEIAARFGGGGHQGAAGFRAGVYVSIDYGLLETLRKRDNGIGGAP